MYLTQDTESDELDFSAFNLYRRKSPLDLIYSQASFDSSEEKRIRTLLPQLAATSAGGIRDQEGVQCFRDVPVSLAAASTRKVCRWLQ